MAEILFRATYFDDGYNIVLNGNVIKSHTAPAGIDGRTVKIFEAANSWIGIMQSGIDPATNPDAALRAQVLKECLDREITMMLEIQSTNISETNSELKFELTLPNGAVGTYAVKRARRPGISGGIIFSITYAKEGIKITEINSYQGPPPYLGVSI